MLEIIKSHDNFHKELLKKQRSFRIYQLGEESSIAQKKTIQTDCKKNMGILR